MSQGGNSGRSWSIMLADLMTPDKGVDLETYGPVEVLIGAVSVSDVTFNGERQDWRKEPSRMSLGHIRSCDELIESIKRRLSRQIRVGLSRLGAMHRSLFSR